MSDNCKNDCPFDEVEWGRLLQLTENIHDMVKLQNGRVRKLEINQGKIMAVAGLLATAIPLLLKFIL